MPATTRLPTQPNPDVLAASFRATLDSADVLGMLYAETYTSRRDLLPHSGDAACLLHRPAPGCDGLCSLAVALIIDDLVGYYHRQVAGGRIAALDNPGGYARSLVRLRHRDVVSALTRPDGGYARPERLARAATRPHYLGLDDAEGLLLATAIAYLRSGSTPTDLDKVGAAAEAACRRAGHRVTHGEGPALLRGVIAHLLTTGGRAASFVQREVLDLLAARSIDSLRDGDDATPAGHVGHSDSDAEERLADALYLREIVTRVEAHLTSVGGWRRASIADRAEAVLTVGADWVERDLATCITLIDDLLGTTAP